MELPFDVFWAPMMDAMSGEMRAELRKTVYDSLHRRYSDMWGTRYDPEPLSAELMASIEMSLRSWDRYAEQVDSRFSFAPNYEIRLLLYE